MGNKLRAVPTADGSILSEKACENYSCASCGAKMISVNFVNGICIQVFVTHKDGCEYYGGAFHERTADVTCDTCAYYDECNMGCLYDGEGNKSISAMHF